MDENSTRLIHRVVVRDRSSKRVVSWVGTYHDFRNAWSRAEEWNRAHGYGSFDNEGVGNGAQYADVIMSEVD